MKLEPGKHEWDQEWSWVAHPDGIDSRSGKIEHMLVARRYDLEILGGIQDAGASYSYDDWALCKLDSDFFLLSTSGCSCPSPKETWRLEIGPATISKIREHLLSGEYDGYTVPKKQQDEFLKLLADAETA